MIGPALPPQNQNSSGVLVGPSGMRRQFSALHKGLAKVDIRPKTPNKLFVPSLQHC